MSQLALSGMEDVTPKELSDRGVDRARSIDDVVGERSVVDRRADLPTLRYTQSGLKSSLHLHN